MVTEHNSSEISGSKEWMTAQLNPDRRAPGAADKIQEQPPVAASATGFPAEFALTLVRSDSRLWLMSVAPP
jgi:hypothetical protein